MALVKWDPWREIDDMFNRYARGTGLQRRALGEGSSGMMDWMPQVDIVESPSEFTIKVEIPEVNKDDVKITVDNGVLSIQGERKQEKEEKDKTFHRIERSYGSFSRSFSLPENADGSATKATFKDGVLVLEIPKVAASKPKAIEVKVG